MKNISLLILCFVAINGFSTTYYVSTTGLDTYAGTSISAPFATVAKALTKAIAGDTIYVRSGTYTLTARLNITKAGTITNNITLSAYPADVISVYPIDGRPVLDFSSLSVGSSNQGIQAKNASYWKIYGLRIKGAGDNGMLVDNCNNFRIEFCDFYKNRDAGFQIRNQSHHCLILNCDSYENADLGTGTTTQGGNADGFAPKLDLGDSITFRGCRAWLNSDDGWDGYLKATEAGLPDGMTTILENCWTWRNGYYWFDGSTTAAQNGNGFKMGGSANKDQAHNFVLVKCLSFYNKAKGYDQNNNAGSISLYNCTAHKNGDNDYGLNSTGVTYATGAVFTVKNCNSLGTKGTTFKTGTVKSNNSFSTATTSTNYTTIDTTGVSGKRKLDGSLPDIGYMHLAQSSALINGGVLLPTVSYYDTIGLRYYGSAPDIGCFESNYSLPVSLVNFELKKIGKEISNTWTTATEINTSHFNIQRSVDGKDFVTVGYVNAKGKGTYEFKDALTPNIELNTGLYYRLEIVDNDGSKTYSTIRFIVLNKKQEAIIIYPNPAKTFVNINCVESKEIFITDYLGRVILSVINPATPLHTINIEYLSRGLYYVKIINKKGDVIVTKLVID